MALGNKTLVKYNEKRKRGVGTLYEANILEQLPQSLLTENYGGDFGLYMKHATREMTLQKCVWWVIGT